MKFAPTSAGALHHRYHLTRGLDRLSANDMPEARDMLILAAAEQPDDPTTQMGLAVAHIAVGDYELGRDALRLLLARYPDPTQFSAGLLGALAWADFMIDTPESLEEGEKASAEAYALLPWAAAVQSTRGAILLARGDAPAALPLLLRSWKGADEADAQASVACNLAVTYARLGEPKRAKAWVRRAARIQPNCQLLPRAHKALAERSAVPSA